VLPKENDQSNQQQKNHTWRYIIINHASLIRFATDENYYSLLEAIVRKLSHKPKPQLSIRPLSVNRITVVRVISILLLMKECGHKPFNRVMW
jgi:hypothetical protein